MESQSAKLIDLEKGRKMCFTLFVLGFEIKVGHIIFT